MPHYFIHLYNILMKSAPEKCRRLAKHVWTQQRPDFVLISYKRCSEPSVARKRCTGSMIKNKAAYTASEFQRNPSNISANKYNTNIIYFFLLPVNRFLKIHKDLTWIDERVDLCYNTDKNKRQLTGGCYGNSACFVRACGADADYRI